MLKYLFIFLCFAQFLNSPSFASPVPSDKALLTLSTPHFEILYYAEQQELAELYANQFEKAYRFLEGVYLSKPEKIIVVLNDSLDQANGFATRIPYPYVMLYPVLPDLNDSISEFDTWSLELATHELGHVLQMEPANGVVKTLRSVFGTIISPNILLPSWWKEGLSVWTETAVSKSGGRLRSIYQEATLRAWVGEKSFLDFTIAQANETLPDWPYGSRPYLFGSLAMCHLIQKHGENVMREIAEGHGGTVPFFYDRVTEPVTKQSYREIYEEGMTKWEDKATKQIAKLSQVPFDIPETVTTPDVVQRSPTFSGDGKYLAWVGVDKRPDARLKLVTLDEKGNMGPLEEVAKGEIKEARFFPRSYKIIYNEMKSASQAESYSDLFIYDIKEKKKTRLTTKIRGREARVNPDETEAVFVGVEGGRTTLKIINLKDTKNVRTLFTSKLDERIASPLYLNDSQILYSFLSQGKESLYVFDLKTNQSALFNSQGKRLRRPLKVGNEIWVMSDLNHVFNLYTVNGNQLSAPKTHVKTTVLDYAVDPKSGSVYAVTMTAEGPKISYFPAKMLKKNVKALPVIEPLVGQISKLGEPKEVDSQAQPGERPYKLWPHYWIPYISGSTASNGVAISVSTSANDPTFQHAYGLAVLYDTGTEQVSYSANYANRAFKWPWALDSFRAARNFAESTDVYYNQLHALTLVPDTMKLSDDWATSISYLSAKYEDDNNTYERHGPSATFSFSNAKETIWMVSPETGGDATISYVHFNKSFRVEEYDQYKAKVGYYFSHWLPERHVLAFEGRALVTDKKIPNVLGDSSTIYSSPLTSAYLARGYLESHFFGRNIYNANLEYRFPIMSYVKWRGLFPLYLKRIHAAVVVDGISVDGAAYKQPQKRYVAVKSDKVFGSAGVEVKADTTLGYVIPLQFVVGVHGPFEPAYNENPNFYIQIKSGIGF